MRIIRVSLLAILALMILSLPVFAYLYRAPLVILESNGNAYTMLPVSVTANNDWMAANDFMKTTALDTRVETLGGTDQPHMIAEDRTLTAVAVPANSQINLYFVTGETDLTSMDIIAGYDGYVTMIDQAALDPGADFDIDQKGYIDTSIQGYLSVTGGNHDSDDTSHTVNLPTGGTSDGTFVVFFVSDSDPVITFPAGWTQLFRKSWAPDVVLEAHYRVADGTEGATIAVTTSNAQRTAHTSYFVSGYIEPPEAGVAVNGNSANPDPPDLAPSWGAVPTLYIAACGYDSNKTIITYPAGYLEGRNDLANDGAGGCGVGTAQKYGEAVASDNPGSFTLSAAEQWAANTVALHFIPRAFLFRGESIVTYVSGVEDISAKVLGATTTTATVNNITSGVRRVRTYINAGNLVLNVYDDDDVLLDSDSLALAAAVPDSTYLWYLGLGNAMPYMDYYKHTVGGVLTVWFQPVTMILGTVLPDRQGAAQDGAFTWGTNPAGVSATLGSMTSSGQPSAGATPTAPTRDLLPDIDSSDWFVDPDVTGALLTNPMRPLVTMLSDTTTTLTELQVWRIYGLAFVLLVTVGTAVSIRNHLLLAGIAAGASIGVCVALTIFPLWALIFAIGAVMGGVVAERSPSL